jgi:hypothetical protein
MKRIVVLLRISNPRAEAIRAGSTPTTNERRGIRHGQRIFLMALRAAVRVGKKIE